MREYQTVDNGKSRVLSRKPHDKRRLEAISWRPILLMLWLSGCSPITPKVQVFEPLNDVGDKPIFVTAARQKDGVKQALRNAGFQVADRIEDSLWLLRVTIGEDQDSKGCGTLNNVRFQLHSEGKDIAEANAKGWTGLCQPNIFDNISQEMWRQLFGELNE